MVLRTPYINPQCSSLQSRLTYPSMSSTLGSITIQMTDPFWGEKLIAKVAENIVSAMKTPILFQNPAT